MEGQPASIALMGNRGIARGMSVICAETLRNRDASGIMRLLDLKLLPRHRDLDGVDQGAADERLEQTGDATGFERTGACRLVVESRHEYDRNGRAAGG